MQSMYMLIRKSNLHLAPQQSSPAEMNPKGRTHDLQAIKKTISKAEKFVYISVMDYFPTFLYQPHNT